MYRMDTKRREEGSEHKEEGSIEIRSRARKNWTRGKINILGTGLCPEALKINNNNS